MKGIVNWYSDRKGRRLIESQDEKNVMNYEKDILFQHYFMQVTL